MFSQSAFSEIPSLFDAHTSIYRPCLYFLSQTAQLLPWDDVKQLLLKKLSRLLLFVVAYQLDFNTTNYFTRYVKRVLGMTPSQYKAKFSVKK